ncbi:right-handed parallel beta-helix repeat-containing protein [Planctomycetota bacterium]
MKIKRKTGLVFVVLIVATLCSGRMITVDDNGSADFNNIQAAIDDANEGDVVEVWPGVYTGDGNRDIDFLGKAITVRGTDSNDPNIVAATIIDCNGTEAEPHRGFNFTNNEDSNSVLSGLTIANGCGPGIIIYDQLRSVGGAIYCEESSPTISKCVIRDNSTWGSYSKGAAIYCHKSSPKINHCIITNNSTEGMYGTGGGIYCTYSYSNPIISHCTIADNSTDSIGSGIYFAYDDNNAVVSHCILWGNYAQRYSQIFGIHFISYCDVEGGWLGVGNIDKDPLFFDSGTGIYHISPNSPCLNAGDPCYSGVSGETDIDGDPRIINRRIDIGVDEVDYERPLIGVSPRVLEFNTLITSPAPEPQNLSIWNNGLGTLNWEIIEDCSWLQVVPNTGESVDQVNNVVLSVDTSGLGWGCHSCELTITGDSVVNSPQTVDVVLNIGGWQLQVPSEYNTIQMAVDVAVHGDTVVVQPGVYEEDVNFLGKNITLTSVNPSDSSVAIATTINGTVVFNGTEDSNCLLTGFNINGYIKGFDSSVDPYGENHTHATISYCLLQDNDGINGMVIHACDGTIRNCIISQSRYWSIWMENEAIFDCFGLIENCTIATNDIAAIRVSEGGTTTIRNCIIYPYTNQDIAWIFGGILDVSYSNIKGGLNGILICGTGSGTVNWGPGNIDIDPCFVEPGRYYNETIIKGDYHLKSQGWRWDAGRQRWDYDDVTSRCIDAGKPGDPLGGELLTVPDDPDNDWGQNLRINMGAYGCTPKASIPPYDWAILPDLTNDGIVNYNDFAAAASDWQETKDTQSGDLNRDGTVDMTDVMLFAVDWLEQTIWR